MLLLSVVLSLSAAIVMGSPIPMGILSVSCLSDPKCGPVPDKSPLYNDYRGKAPPFPMGYKQPIPPAASGDPAPDDVLWQNLLAAEWVISNFYQQGVEAFNESSFTALGLPNTTYDRLCEIRDNEAGHLRIFQDQISATSVKPGMCEYDFGFGTDPEIFLALQLVIEVTSQAFLSGPVQMAYRNATRGALVGVAEVETRHNVWALIDVWGANPFAGPIDTVFPYANEILDVTNNFVVAGSCPMGNPIYPNPRQNLPLMLLNSSLSNGRVGCEVGFVFAQPNNQPNFNSSKEYYAVFFHGVQNITVPYNIENSSSVVPSAFDQGKGIILAVIATKPGAPELESVMAGPLILLQQPSNLPSAT